MYVNIIYVKTYLGFRCMIIAVMELLMVVHKSIVFSVFMYRSYCVGGC